MKPTLFWKVGDNYYTDYEEALKALKNE